MEQKYIDKINKLGFTIIEDCSNLNKDETLYVTGCCAKKKEGSRMKVRDLYLSPRCQTFFKNIRGYNAGIISEKYGLVRLDQEVDNYNFGPKDLKANPSLIPILQEKLKNQVKEDESKNLVIFGPPLMTIGFMNLLRKVECNKYLCYGTNRLNKVNEGIKKDKVNKDKNKPYIITYKKLF